MGHKDHKRQAPSMDIIDGSLQDGSLWDKFCDELKEAGKLILREQAPDDPLTRAEGYRYLTRLLRVGLESLVECSDPRFPVFYSLANETIKIGNDNPDNYYLNATLSGRYDYLLTGCLGEVSYFSLATKAGSYATTGRMEATGELVSDQLHIDADGRFEILLSTNPPNNAQRINWLPMTQDTDSLLIRQYCNAHQEEPASFKIQCLDKEADNRLDATIFADNLLRSVKFVKGTSQLFTDWMDNFSQHINQLPSNDQEVCIEAGGNAAIHYMNSYWQLTDDEALVIRPSKIPQCETWNFQLSNYWMESLDYRYYRVVVNKDTAVYDADGSVTIVVAHQNPGERFPNWLNTTGHRQGGMLFRWIATDEFPPVDTRVVKFSDLLSGGFSVSLFESDESQGVKSHE